MMARRSGRISPAGISALQTRPRLPWPGMLVAWSENLVLRATLFRPDNGDKNQKRRKHRSSFRPAHLRPLGEVRFASGRRSPTQTGEGGGRRKKRLYAFSSPPSILFRARRPAA